MEAIEKSRKYLKNLTNSKYLLFTRRGNASIDIALDIAKKKGYTKLIIPEDGSWLHYPIAAKKKKLEIISLKTELAHFELKILESLLDEKSILIYHTHSGYFYKQNTKKIFELCKKKKSFIICDASGALGMSLISEKYSELHSSLVCDILVSSMRKDKPVLADGGLIATNDDSIGKDITSLSDFEMNYSFLFDRLSLLKKRLNFLFSVTEKHSNILRKEKFNVLNDDFSLVILVLFNSIIEKEKIIDYCEKNNLEYTVCPREIRINRDAVSLEIKRLEEK